jgi:nucleotide-binding universal stress UspA family protein
MIQDLVLPVTGTAGDTQALDAAIALAGALDARLAVLHLLNLPNPALGPLGLAPDYLYSDLYVKLREAANDAAGRVEQRLRREGIGGEVRVVETFASDPPYPLQMHARYADLSILPGMGKEGGFRASSFFHGLLFESGRPVLVVPPDVPAPVPAGHAVVAWQPTREATRALHDAMPLLHRCTSIDVLVVDAKPGPAGHGEDPGADIAAHLARHGLVVNLVAKSSAGTAIGDTLLRHCRESGAQLLVAGGYGHSRMRQWALGGTTRDLFENLRLPVLFSH